MKSGSFGFNGRCAYITSADGMVHPARNETVSAFHGKKKGMYEYKPLKGEDINLCLACDRSACDGGEHCPLRLTIITLEEYQVFRSWLIESLNHGLSYGKITEITDISWHGAHSIVSGEYPGKRIQRKIKTWLEANRS